MSIQRFILASFFAGGLSAYAGAAPITVFSANFETGGIGADVGTLAINNSPVVTNIATSVTDPVLGNNVLLIDQENPQVNPLNFDLVFTDTLSLSGMDTATFSFDVAARRTSGTSKTHYVTGYDSTGSEVFQLLLGDGAGFGPGTWSRQRPGYVTAAGGAASLLAGSGLGEWYWYGADGSEADFDVTKDANFVLTVGNGGWDVTTTNAGGTTHTAAGLSLFNGGTASDLAGITITSNGTNAGNWWDNFSVQGTPVPEPSSLALIGLGGLAMIKRR